MMGYRLRPRRVLARLCDDPVGTPSAESDPRGTRTSGASRGTLMNRRHEDFLDRWAAKTHGLMPENLSISEVMKRIPRRRGLRYGTAGSPLGGRIAPHLKHPSDEESDRLVAGADRFLQDTPEPQEASESEPRLAGR